MTRRVVMVPNELGLHMRAANVFVEHAGGYRARILVSRGDLCVNGKSIMGLMMLAAPMGTELAIEVEGPDEESAAEDLVRVVESGFGEGVSENSEEAK